MKTGIYQKVAKIFVRCPGCNQEHEVYAHYQTRKCWRCNTKFKVPKVELIDISGTLHDSPYVRHDDIFPITPEGARQ